MKWTTKVVDQLIREMAAQAKASAWGDRHAVDRMRILTEILKRYGWVRRDRHPPDIYNTAVLVAFHAPAPGNPGSHHGTEGHVLRLQVLGCLFAESHVTAVPGTGREQSPRRRRFGLGQRTGQKATQGTTAQDRVVREQFARTLDQMLTDLNAPTVFGTAPPEYHNGKLVYPDLCCPNDLLWLRSSLGIPEMDSSVQHL